MSCPHGFENADYCGTCVSAHDVRSGCYQQHELYKSIAEVVLKYKNDLIKTLARQDVNPDSPVNLWLELADIVSDTVSCK